VGIVNVVCIFKSLPRICMSCPF